jgi:NH3-dependent NAD+ synthetase
MFSVRACFNAIKDCSSADVNPIGSIDKSDLISFLRWATTNFDLPVLADFIAATPTAEVSQENLQLIEDVNQKKLVPFSDSYTQ